MSLVTDIVSAELIDDLWGAGFTILPRLRDPFELPKELIPRGMSYQWNETATQSGWTPVPYDRHPGYFGPVGIGGDINVSRLWLCERPTAQVEAAKAKQIADAQKPLQDWAERNKEFTGGARVVSDAGVLHVHAGSEPKLFQTSIMDGVESIPTKTIESTVAIPRDMTPYIASIFKERDRLKDEIVLPDRMLLKGDIADKFYAAIDADKSLPWWPTLHAILLPIAIENVRKSLKQETEL